MATCGCGVMSIEDVRVDSSIAPCLKIDHCLFFPKIDAPGGFLYVQGWSYDGSQKTPTTVDVRFSLHRLGSLTCTQPREDVQDHLGVRQMLGFGGFFMLDKVPDAIDVVGVTLKTADGHTLRALEAPFIATDLPTRPKLSNLSPLKRMKLENLILNERERLSQTINLKSKPLYLQLDPSFQCNLRCPYCHGNMMRREGVKMPQMHLNEAKAVFEEFGPTLIQAHLFNWGEPLLNENLHLFIREAKKYEVWCSVSSNLSIPLSDQRIDQLIEEGLDFVVMGTDGITQKSYETYRVGGDVNLVLDNARRFAERKRVLGSKTPFLQFQFLDFPHNRHEIEEARKIAEGFGVDEFHVKGGCIHPKPSNWDPHGKPVDDWVTTSDETLEELRGWKREKEAANHYFGCDHLYQQLSINSDGSVHPCCYVYEPRHAIGNINKEPAANFFNHKKMQSGRKVMRDIDHDDVGGHDPCANCWIVGEDDARGHKETAINFLSGLQLLQEERIDILLTNPGHWLNRLQDRAPMLV